ncbi:MAG: PEP-CTERM sorting domain-containing protein [Gallionellaceae bacterium]|nr:PEP-CTERM sorting domain-containing protein [Gallionellaceae bacterium]
MSSKSVITLTPLLLLVSGGVVATPLVIDFQDLVPPPTSYAYYGVHTIPSQGFTFSGPATLYLNPGAGTICYPSCATNGTTTLISFDSNGDLTMTRTAGGTFEISGFEYGETFSGGPAYADGTAQKLSIQGFLLNSAVFSYTYTMDFLNDGFGGNNDFQTASFAPALVDKVTFRGLNNSYVYNARFGFSLDNVRVDVAGTVPEPTSFALFSLGLAGLGFARRRKA